MSIERHKKGEIKVDSLDLERAPTSPVELAQEIMGTENVFSPEDAETHFGLTPTQEDRKALATIPFSEQELKECKDTHMLVAILPISILDLNEKLAEKYPGTKFLFNTAWYKDEAFVKEKGSAHWALVRKTPVPNSTSKRWDEQLALLSEEEDVPEARDLLYSIFAHFKETSERLFSKIYVRTKTVVSHGERVDVGDFDADGLDVNAWRDDDRYPDFGLALARKSSGEKLETPIAKQEPVPISRNF